MIITAENAGDFFYVQDAPLKAVLFTKKSETPGLWLRLAEAWGNKCKFGEIRHTEKDLMERFSMMESLLPKVIVMLQTTPEDTETLTYEGPTDFEHISSFIGDAVQGGASAVELRKKLEQKDREIKSLRVELNEAKQALTSSQAEVARAKLGQVGKVEEVRKVLEAEAQKAREKEAAALQQLAEEREAFEHQIRVLEKVRLP